MQGAPRIIGLLNQVLRKELTGINQYFIHSRMCKNWSHGVVDEEHYIDWIKAQRHKIAEVGYQQHLAQQIYA